MRNWLLFLSLAWGFAGWCAAANISAYGDKPSEGIYDPGEWITGSAKNVIKRELTLPKEGADIDLLVAVVEDPGENPQALVDQLAQRWSKDGAVTVLLFVPKNSGSPWISMGGLTRDRIPDATLMPILKRAKTRARGDSTINGAVYKAVHSLADDLSFVGGRVAHSNFVPPQAPPPNLRTSAYLFIEQLKSLMIPLMIGLILLGALAFWLVRIWRQTRLKLVTKSFPEISWNPRFGAPYAGIVYTHPPKISNHRLKDGIE